MCVLQGTLYLQIGYGQARGRVLPRCNSICGKQSAAEYTQRFRHLNRKITQINRCNLLRNFLLYGFSKHLYRFRCSGKGEYLNPASRQNPVFNPLITNALQNFQRLHPWFRCQPGLEHRRMQIRHGSTSGKGLHQTRDSTAHASEPEQNPKNSLQLIERLSVVWFQQASPPVQMQRKMGASEPCSKVESGSQAAHNKHIAGLLATTPMVQIPDGFGMSRNANALWRCFWQGCPPTSQQNSPCI